MGNIFMGNTPWADLVRAITGPSVQLETDRPGIEASATLELD